MLEKYRDRLLVDMQGATEFIMALPAEDRAAWEELPPAERQRLTARADQWMDAPVPMLTASSYISFSRAGIAADYEKNRRIRREMLRDLVIGSCVVPDGRYDMKLADVVWAICEESSWVSPANNLSAQGRGDRPLPDADQPRVDRSAAETACDLALTVQMVSSRLDAVSPQLIERIVREVDRRVIRPFRTLAGTVWMCGPKGDAMRCLSGCMMAFWTFEESSQHRWACAGKAMDLFDRLLTALPADGSIPGGVDDWAQIVEPVIDIVMMALSVSRGSVDMRREKQIRLMAHYPVFCHMAQGWFLNAGAHSMRTALPAALLYRLGAYVQDEALCDLGVFLSRTQEQEERGGSLLHFSADLFNEQAMAEDAVRPPFRRQGYYALAQIMVARQEEDSERALALAVRGGANGDVSAHADAGNFILFCEGEPVLADAGFLGDTAYHNLPLIGGAGQSLGASFGAQDVSCRLEDDYAMISMNLAAAYPPQSGVYAWQRTLVYERPQNTVQLMEFFDLKDFSSVSFHFITPYEPELGDGWAQLGPVRMRWEPGLTASRQRLDVPEGWRSVWGEALYLIALDTDEPVENGRRTFAFNALRTFG